MGRIDRLAERWQERRQPTQPRRADWRYAWVVGVYLSIGLLVGAEYGWAAAGAVLMCLSPLLALVVWGLYESTRATLSDADPS